MMKLRLLKIMIQTLADLPLILPQLGIQWVLEKKLKQNGSINKCKGRLVAKGRNRFSRTTFPITELTSCRIMMPLESI